jgi:hypothetical protein
MNIHSTHSGGQRLQAERGLPERRRWPRYLLGAVVAAGSAVIAVGLGSSSASADDFDFAPDPFDSYAPPSSWGSADPYGSSTGLGSPTDPAMAVDTSNIGFTTGNFELGGGSAVDSSSTGTELFASIDQVNSQTSTGSLPPNTNFQLDTVLQPETSFQPGDDPFVEQLNDGSGATTLAALPTTAEEATGALTDDPYIDTSTSPLTVLSVASSDPESGEGLSDVTTQPAEALIQVDNGEQVPLTLPTELVDSAVPAEGEPVPTADDGSTGVTTQLDEVVPTVNPEVSVTEVPVTEVSVTEPGPDPVIQKTPVESAGQAVHIGGDVAMLTPMSPDDELSIDPNVILPEFGVEAAPGQPVVPQVTVTPLGTPGNLRGVNVGVVARDDNTLAALGVTGTNNGDGGTEVQGDLAVQQQFAEGVQGGFNVTGIGTQNPQASFTGQLGNPAEGDPTLRFTQPGTGGAPTVTGILPLGPFTITGRLNPGGPPTGAVEYRNGNFAVTAQVGTDPRIGFQVKDVAPPVRLDPTMLAGPSEQAVEQFRQKQLDLLNQPQLQPLLPEPDTFNVSGASPTGDATAPPGATTDTNPLGLTGTQFNLTDSPADTQFTPPTVTVQPNLLSTLGSDTDVVLPSFDQPPAASVTNSVGLADTQFDLTGDPAGAPGAADPLVSGAGGDVLVASNPSNVQSDSSTPLLSTGRMLASENCGQAGTVTAETWNEIQTTYTHCQSATADRLYERNNNVAAGGCVAGASTLAAIGGYQLATGAGAPVGAGTALAGGLWAVGCGVGKEAGAYRILTFRTIAKACEEDGKRLGVTTVLVVTQNRFTTSREFACEIR